MARRAHLLPLADEITGRPSQEGRLAWYIEQIGPDLQPCIEEIMALHKDDAAYLRKVNTRFWKDEDMTTSKFVDQRLSGLVKTLEVLKGI